MIQVTKELTFCCAHRLYRYSGHCQNLHGHNYRVFVTLQGDTLDSLGMVIDFGWIKRMFGGWLDEHWDHTTLYNEKDTVMVPVVTALNKIQTKPCYALSGNPTAEYMALYLKAVFSTLLSEQGIDATLVSVAVYETATSYAEAIRD